MFIELSNSHGHLRFRRTSKDEFLYTRHPAKRRTDGRTDGRRHTIIRPVLGRALRRAYKNYYFTSLKQLTYFSKVSHTKGFFYFPGPE